MYPVPPLIEKLSLKQDAPTSGVLQKPGTIYTQLRPGKDDYQLWLKIKAPAGSDKYERWDLETIDPDYSAPDFEVRFPKPKRFKKVLEDAAEESRITLGGTSETEPEDGTPNKPEEDAAGFLTVTNKRTRSSPGEENSRKKNKVDNLEKNDVFYRNILAGNGLRGILKGF